MSVQILCERTSCLNMVIMDSFYHLGTIFLTQQCGCHLCTGWFIRLVPTSCWHQNKCCISFQYMLLIGEISDGKIRFFSCEPPLLCIVFPVAQRLLAACWDILWATGTTIHLERFMRKKSDLCDRKFANTKLQLLFRCQQEVGTNLMGHPVWSLMIL